MVAAAQKAKKPGGPGKLGGGKPRNPQEELFVKHLETMSLGDGTTVLATTPQRVGKVQHLLKRLNVPEPVLCLLPAVEGYPPPKNPPLDPSAWRTVDEINALGTDCNGVVIVSNQFKEHMACQGQFNQLKDLGVPVVSAFGYPAMLTPPPGNVATTGVNYQGMFSMAARWAAAARFKNPTYIEFGTLEGRTTTFAWHYMRHIPNMRFVAFDSFAGIRGTIDSEEYLFPEGSFYANHETFMHNMNVCGVDLDRLETVKCDISDLADNPGIAAGIDLGTPAVINIDVDVYAPALSALEFLSPHMRQGSLILMDDYDSMRASNKAGERMALREWLANNPHFEAEEWRSYGAWGRSFIVHTADGE